MRFSIVGQLPLEIVAWLRDVFGLEQQVVTSALSINCLCPVTPSVLGTSWGDSPVGIYWRVTVDNFCPDKAGPVAPWSREDLEGSLVMHPSPWLSGEERRTYQI